MLKRDITYEDFDGEKVTETFYFNLTKSEIIELEVGYKEGLQEVLQRIIKTEDKKRLIEEFKRIILLSYGERSEDGKRFIKNDGLREAFSQTAAYDALFIELATNEESAALFIKGIIPKDFVQEVEKAEVVNLPALAKD
ncbi:MAG: hypothetical protein ABW007_24330 [Chitinophagaceae bacterium]